MRLLGMISIVPLLISTSVSLGAPDWSRDAEIPVGGRGNPYGFAPEVLSQNVRAGRLHALHYPVEISGVQLPFEPLRRTIERVARFDDLEARFGLLAYPESEGLGPYFVPFVDGRRPAHRMGATITETARGPSFTVSCAQCHTGSLFGRKVIGLTNRFPRANEMFVHGLALAPHVTPSVFKALTGATAEETEMFRDSRRALAFVGAKKPVQLGLDTSLAQVALSLAKRDDDAWASRTKPRKREEPLKRFVADSKPAVWWNLKYKNRWLSDGSIVSGNPIFTNFLWNEIGRGTDLHELQEWFDRNETTIEELTTAVFASEAPRFTDFFPAETFPIDAAMRGEKIFEKKCSRCHGHYEKAWSRPTAAVLTMREKLETTNVVYANRVVDVGTDPQRYQGMRSLMKLNALEISKRNGIVVEAQEGYVPPPLVGIWARWPYFHNNSVPTLCAVLSPPPSRPSTYWAREAIDPSRDFDRDCNGYPSSKPPAAKAELRFDTAKPGSSNRGHDVGPFTAAERSDLIRFLQTL